MDEWDLYDYDMTPDYEKFERAMCDADRSIEIRDAELDSLPEF
jgi:hypothetical protein